MATYTKTNQGDLLALQSVAASSVVVGSAKDVFHRARRHVLRQNRAALGNRCGCCVQSAP